MSDQDDLAAALDKITQSVTNGIVEIQLEASQILANVQNNDSAAIKAAVGRINTLADNMNAAVSAAQAPAPAPAPDPAPAPVSDGGAPAASTDQPSPGPTP